MLELLADIASTSELITIDVRRDDAPLKPSFALHPPEALPRVRFAGLPMGHEFRPWCWRCCKPAATRRRWIPP